MGEQPAPSTPVIPLYWHLALTRCFLIHHRICEVTIVLILETRKPGCKGLPGQESIQGRASPSCSPPLPLLSCSAETHQSAKFPTHWPMAQQLGPSALKAEQGDVSIQRPPERECRLLQCSHSSSEGCWSEGKRNLEAQSPELEFGEALSPEDNSAVPPAVPGLKPPPHPRSQNMTRISLTWQFLRD